MAIELESVSKTYRMDDVGIKVLSDVSFHVKGGEFVSITGPSGSGKSTMLHMIGCLDRPTSGRVMVDGKDISHMSDSELAVLRGNKIGFIFQAFNLVPRLTALENVLLPMWFADNVDEKKASGLLDQVGLSHRMNNRPSQLSGGERQRVAIARALANDPDVIVADEPTGNLDSKTGSEVMKMLSEIHETGRTLILVTHDMKIAELAGRRVEMKDGRIIKEMIK